MKTLFGSLLFALIVVYANAHDAKYWCKSNGLARDIIVTLTPATGVAIRDIRWTSTCNGVTYTTGQDLVIPVVNGAGADVTDCGVTKTLAGGYQVAFTTNRCSGCSQAGDVTFTVTCDAFADTLTTPLTATKVDVAGDVTIGTAKKKDGPKGSMAVVGATGNTITFGDEMSLQITLGAAAEIHVTSCSVESEAEPTAKMEIFKADGCTVANLGLIADDMGFTQASTTLYNSPKFPAFILHGNHKDLVFKCTIAECETTGCGLKSCATQARRKRRAVDNTKSSRVLVMLTVNTDNSTRTSVPRTGERDPMSVNECSNQSYVIGLIILGCVLVLTFVVSIGMFIILKRNRQGNEKSIS